jgi:hypothetical protein
MKTKKLIARTSFNDYEICYDGYDGYEVMCGGVHDCVHDVVHDDAYYDEYYCEY